MEPLEEYLSPFDFEQGVNTSYLYLSPAYGDTPPSSPTLKTRGSQQHPDSLPELGQDAVTSVGPSSPLPPAMTEEERLELQEELARVEDEIQTLSQVLADKERQVAEMKRKLGISPLNELKQNITKTWQEVTTSTAYKRTSETLSQAGQKATAAFTNMGSAISRKLEDVRNAPTFKSFEEKVETLKTKITPSAPGGRSGSQDDGVPQTTDSDGFPAQDAPLH
ncbi:tumor protein D52 isoform X2 [Nothobranchius furzeri]|uniref:Transcript variant X2 n=1 Tax=Nothobranchius furzeri TaxID=105023 RepID=A0A9D3BIE4_NOTFU|nr:tumor protein D52 isoform X2 [Nothobranchius furzeri]KAF7211132.1 transcript variant X2 [Nothobranchius furzeri]